ncbi:MAG: hypothetical protein Q8L37_03985 [Candidatus Gottesmanbacteria bacterium]|nr:hypothetical protein [Candidatus Gottesmanbacteria bacterium]
MSDIYNKKKVTDEEVRQLVIARLRSFPSSKKLSIGSDGEFSKEELIDRVGKNDPVGNKIIQIQLSYLQSLKEGLTFEE